MKNLLLSLFFILMGCQSTPGSNVDIGSERPTGQCHEIGQVIGTSSSIKNAKEKAMADIRKEASHLQANYVRVLAVSAHGAAVRGIAYQCK